MPGNKKKRSHSKRPKKRFPDSDNIFTIVKYLRKHYLIRMAQMIQECVIGFTSSGCKIYGDHMSHKYISALAKKQLIHNPDIIVMDKYDNPNLIIEIDGKIHNSEDVIIRDKKRNKHYEEQKIPFIIINTPLLKKKKKNIFEYIDEEMEKAGWTRKN